GSPASRDGGRPVHHTGFAIGGIHFLWAVVRIALQALESRPASLCRVPPILVVLGREEALETE
ncbi:MAG: hypothetical protein KDB11_34775, partial [Planctomycetales bacterium]|nr:hypothetical protein [Planctomycetales bacterium]